MLRKEDVIIEQQYEYIYRARLPELDIEAYGFSIEMAFNRLIKSYTQYHYYFKIRDDSLHNAIYI
jgi:hypothetical protein